ncbi:MAG TPA: ABC transporter permease [Ktedonobacteraceae bacterium]|nr:ABC transporter permease [Ktedonobacteraceae bacterium]
MNIPALANTGQHIWTMKRAHPLARVLIWELHRFRVSRLFWVQALSFFGLFLFLTWVSGTSIEFSYGEFSGLIAGTSAHGLLLILPTVLLLLVLLLPFVTADGVTRDLHRRTSELLLTTALPTRAYIWGRYLVGLTMSLGLAVLLLCATFLMGWLLHLVIPLYPAPQVEAVFSLWGGLVVPATILVSSLSFALGTLFPRQSTLIKIAVLAAWTVGAEILPFSLGRMLISTWYSNWDPTGAVTALKILSQTPDSQLNTVASMAQFQQVLLSYENTMPGIGEWFIPHLILAAVSLGLVALAASTFQRSRVPFQG